MEATRDDVLAVADATPRAVGGLGLALLERVGADPGDDQAPVGQRLAAAGLSLSGLQQLVDALVTDGQLVEVRGKDLWDRGLPTAGTKATGRYYLAPDATSEDLPVEP